MTVEGTLPRITFAVGADLVRLLGQLLDLRELEPATATSRSTVSAKPCPAGPKPTMAVTGASSAVTPARWATPRNAEWERAE